MLNADLIFTFHIMYYKLIIQCSNGRYNQSAFLSLSVKSVSEVSLTSIQSSKGKKLNGCGKGRSL